MHGPGARPLLSATWGRPGSCIGSACARPCPEFPAARGADQRGSTRCDDRRPWRANMAGCVGISDRWFRGGDPGRGNRPAARCGVGTGGDRAGKNSVPPRLQRGPECSDRPRGDSDQGDGGTRRSEDGDDGPRGRSDLADRQHAGHCPDGSKRSDCCSRTPSLRPDRCTPTQTKVEAGGTLKLNVTLERSADWSGAVQLSGFDLPPDAKAAAGEPGGGVGRCRIRGGVTPQSEAWSYTFLVQGSGQVPRDYGIKSGSKDSAGTKIRAVYPSNPITITVSESSQAAR